MGQSISPFISAMTIRDICDMTNSYVPWLICVTCCMKVSCRSCGNLYIVIHMCYLSTSHEWVTKRVTNEWVMYRVYISSFTSAICYGNTYVIWLIHGTIYVTWLIHGTIWDMTHSWDNMWHDSYGRTTSLNESCHIMSRICYGNTYVTWLIHGTIYVTWLIHGTIWDMTHMGERRPWMSHVT